MLPTNASLGNETEYLGLCWQNVLSWKNMTAIGNEAWKPGKDGALLWIPPAVVILIYKLPSPRHTYIFCNTEGNIAYLACWWELSDIMFLISSGHPPYQTLQMSSKGEKVLLAHLFPCRLQVSSIHLLKSKTIHLNNKHILLHLRTVLIRKACQYSCSDYTISLRRELWLG